MVIVKLLSSNPLVWKKTSRDGHVASSIEIEQFKNPDIDPVALLKCTLIRLKICEQTKLYL